MPGAAVMIMSIPQIALSILIVAGATALTRYLPFLLFPTELQTPKYVSYLGHVLPCAVIAMLIVYCLRNIPPAIWPHGLPELLSIALVVLIQIPFRNTLASIAAGTALYMVLIRTVFL